MEGRTRTCALSTHLVFASLLQLTVQRCAMDGRVHSHGDGKAGSALSGHAHPRMDPIRGHACILEAACWDDMTQSLRGHEPCSHDDGDEEDGFCMAAGSAAGRGGGGVDALDALAAVVQQELKGQEDRGALEGKESRWENEQSRSMHADVHACDGSICGGDEDATVHVKLEPGAGHLAICMHADAAAAHSLDTACDPHDPHDHKEAGGLQRRPCKRLRM